MTTVWPRDWRPRAASMTRRSAPPMPRSGWMKMIVSFFGGGAFLRGWGIDCFVWVVLFVNICTYICMYVGGRVGEKWILSILQIYSV